MSTLFRLGLQLGRRGSPRCSQPSKVHADRLEAFLKKYSPQTIPN